LIEPTDYFYITVMEKIESTVRIEFEVEMVLEALILCFEFCKLCPNTFKQFQVQQVILLDEILVSGSE